MAVDREFRFLVVDDDPCDRHLVRRYCAPNAAITHHHEATSVDEAIEVCVDHRIDLVLLDMRLVQTQGMETIQRFRDAVPDVRLVVASGLIQSSFLDAAAEFNVHEFVCKDDYSQDMLQRLVDGARSDGAPSSATRSSAITSDAPRTSVAEHETTVIAEQAKNGCESSSVVDGLQCGTNAGAAPSPMPHFGDEDVTATTRPPGVVMIVDDEEADLYLLTRYIRLAFGETVCIQTACDGFDAMERLCQMASDPHHDLPDLIILDLNMPRKDGHQTLCEIRDHKTLESIPVVINSTSSWTADVTRTVANGANVFLSKPSSLSEWDGFVNRLRDEWTAMDRPNFASS